MAYTLRLSNPHNGFFDPETRLHLHFYQPQGTVEVLSEAIQIALRGKTLIDVGGNTVISKEVDELDIKADPRLIAKEAEEVEEPEIEEDEIEEGEEEAETEEVEAKEEAEEVVEEEPKKKPASKRKTTNKKK